MKKLICAALCILTIMPLSSCYDAKEIEEVGYIIAIGADKGSGSALKYTFQFVKPLAMENSSGGGDDGDKGSGVTANVSVEAPSFYLAMNQLEDQMNEAVDLSHCQIFVFSKELAEGGLRPFIEMMNGNPDFNPRLQLAVAGGEAGEYLKNVDSVLFANPAKNYQAAGSGRTLFPYTAFADLRGISDPAGTGRDAVLPLYAVSGDDEPDPPPGGEPLTVSDTVEGVGPADVSSPVKIQSAGGAVFAGQTMAGEFDRDEVFLYRLLRGEIQNVHMAVNDSAGAADPAFSVKLAGPCESRIKMEGGAPVINYDVRLECDLLSGGADDFYGAQAAISNAARDAVQKLLNKTAVLGADVFGFGAWYKMSFLAWDDWTREGWPEKYKNARFNVTVTARVTRSGEYLH